MTEKRRGNPNWVKGMGSANPGGRPRMSAGLKALYKKDAKEGRKIAAKMMRDEEQPGAVRMRAIEFLTDRAFGRAIQATEISGPEGGPIETQLSQMGDDQIADRLAQILPVLAAAGITLKVGS